MYGMRPTRTSGRLGARRVEGAQDVVERVALGGDFFGAADEREERIEGHALRRLRTDGMVDLLTDDGALHVVHAEGECRLREEGGHHDPVRLDVREVVEK